MRSAFYAGYEDSDREHVMIGEAGRRLADGKSLVSTGFVVPYPPGFPVLVPGQVISKQILYFLAQLDVKEIHGYNPDLGLSVFTEDALKRINAARCCRRRDRVVLHCIEREPVVQNRRFLATVSRRALLPRGAPTP